MLADELEELTRKVHASMSPSETNLTLIKLIKLLIEAIDVLESRTDTLKPMDTYFDNLGNLKASI